MKKILFTLAALMAWAFFACTSPQPRTVENPAVEATNCSNLRLTKAELTDSNTTLSFHVVYRPGWWIRIDSASHLVADGKQYAVTGSENLVLGEQFIMPESGEADFTLTFEPVPLATGSIDFTEGTPDGWNFFGINVSGEPKKATDALAALPKEIKDIDMTEIFAEPILEAAPSELRFHVLGYRPEYGDKLNIIIQDAGHASMETVTLDENGNGTFAAPLFGTTQVYFRNIEGLNTNSGSVRVAPDETTDIYVMPAVFSDYSAMRIDENAKRNLPYVLSNGRYAAFNNAKITLDTLSYERAKFDWRMSADDYCKAVLAQHKARVEAINASDLPATMKEFGIKEANVNALLSLPDAFNNLAVAYINEKGPKGMTDSVKIEIGPEQYAAMAQLIDGDDTSYLMFPDLRYFVSDPKWKEAGANGMIFDQLPVYIKALEKAGAARLDNGDIAELTALSLPFFAQSAKLQQDKAQKAFEEAQKSIAENPDVPDDMLFDAIVAKHKGKVVLVDLWNTWCAPCRGALKANEPLKTGELADDDIVWIYIADESSDLSHYNRMIKDIKGEHHIVNEAQIKAIRKRFNVDGIPYYILVDREGKAQGHPDFRDHTKLVKGIKEALSRK